jgi:glucose dehydrogenase
MTILLVVISLVAGIALGQWFKILILVPVMSLALVGTIAAGIARADNVWSIALMAIAVVTALQIGYLIGIWLRSFIVAARFARPSSASEATRRAPAAVAQLFGRDLAGMTEPHNEDQEHSIDRPSRDRTQCRRKVGPTH